MFNNNSVVRRHDGSAQAVEDSAAAAWTPPAHYRTQGWPDADAAARQPSFVEAMLRHKLAIIITAVAGGVLGYALTIPQTRVYRAHVSLEFTGINENVMNTRDVDPSATADNSSQAYINTEARVLESQPLLQRVIDTVRHQNLPAAKPGTEERRQMAIKELNPAVLSQDLQVRPVDGTKLIDIYVQSRDPDVAAALANTIIGEYMAQTMENRANATQLTSGWLSKQVAEAKARLEASEAALQAYARHANLLFTGSEDGTVSEARLRQIQEEYSRAQADRAAKESIYEQLLNENPEDKTASLRDPALADYQMKLSDLNRQFADLSAVYGPENEKLRRVQSQLDELKKEYNKQHDAALIRVKNDFDTAQRREALLAKAFSAQEGMVQSDAAKAVDYNILKREAETNRAIYEGMLQKIKSYGIASAIQPSNARLVDPAETPRFPYKPNVPLTTMFGTMAGFMLAVIWVGVRDKGIVHVEYPGQTKQVLQTPELGVIPAASLDPWLGRSRTRRIAGGFGRGGLVRAVSSDPSQTEGGELKKGVETATWFCKSSLLAESVRSIRTSLLFKQFAPSPQVIVVSSLGPAHGKTSLVSNLGIAMTEIGKRTLVIDADLRCPTLHKSFGVANEIGLTSLLTAAEPLSSADLKAATQSAGISNLSILASGCINRLSVSALFHSDRMSELIALSRAAYDIVLIDTAPLMLSDARILGPYADGVILVLRAGEVKMESVRAAEERLTEDGSRVLGTVLNNWDPRSNGYGSYPDRYHKRSYYQPAAQ